MKRILVSAFLVLTLMHSNAQENISISKSEYEAIIDSINYEYLNYLFQDKRPSIAADFASLPNNVSYTEPEFKPKSKNTSWGWYILTGFIGFSVGIILMLIMRRRPTKAHQVSKVSTHDSQTNIDLSSHSLRMGNRDREIENLRNDIALLRKQHETDRETAERALMARPVQSDDSDSAGIDANPVKQTGYPALYFPNPTSDGYFLADNGRNTFTEGASIYKFTLSSPSEATFEYCEDTSSVKIALNNRNELILSVAEEASAYNPSANKIIAEQSGKVILEGSIWKVTKKAKIKYI